MFLIERSVPLPRSRPQTQDGTIARTPPVPATFLERAAGGAFELFPRRQFPGGGDLVQASLVQPALVQASLAQASLVQQPPSARRSLTELPPAPHVGLSPTRQKRRRSA